MNKRYMDFVPTKASRLVKKESRKSDFGRSAQSQTKTKTKTQTRLQPQIKSQPRATKTISSVETEDIEISEILEMREEKPRAGVSLARKKDPKYGVIEDFRPKFVNTEVKKRPLNREREAKEEIAAIKAKKIVEKKSLKKAVVAGPEGTSEELKKEKTEEKAAETLKIPKMPRTYFVNTEKVAKRPLSKNVYKKEVVASKEEPTETVTIIGDTKKESKMGLILTILITIILGAAAGTVAYLLLPK
ncbi:MAG: hypothetical protein Q4A79_03440 [Candidatus Saccharibacteria bacterium]|nr:hypothetical protein [Candidatus Saccharibacteria bacterium]